MAKRGGWSRRLASRVRDSIPLLPRRNPERAAEPPPSVVGHPRLAPFPDRTTGRKTVAVTIFGLDREALAAVLDKVDAVCTARDAVPVVLTDCDAFDLLRERDMPFDHLPSADQRDRFEPGLDWATYFVRRLEVFTRKWQPDGYVAFGTRSPTPGFKERLDALIAERAPREPSSTA